MLPPAAPPPQPPCGKEACTAVMTWHAAAGSDEQACDHMRDNASAALSALSQANRPATCSARCWRVQGAGASWAAPSGHPPVGPVPDDVHCVDAPRLGQLDDVLQELIAADQGADAQSTLSPGRLCSLLRARMLGTATHRGGRGQLGTATDRGGGGGTVGTAHPPHVAGGAVLHNGVPFLQVHKLFQQAHSRRWAAVRWKWRVSARAGMGQA